eukprot:1368165-Rhodomonas_salina.1
MECAGREACVSVHREPHMQGMPRMRGNKAGSLHRADDHSCEICFPALPLVGTLTSRDRGQMEAL